MAHHDCTECNLNDFSLHQRVKAHPATDSFMRGDVYGEVVAIAATKVTVKMDRSGRHRMFTRCNLLPVD